MEDTNKKNKLKTVAIIFCIIVIIAFVILAIVKFSVKKEENEKNETMSNEEIINNLALPAIIRYDEEGEIVKTVELKQEDLYILDAWIYLSDFYLEDLGFDPALEHIKIRKDVVIKYSDSIEIYIELGEEYYCYYINKDKNISSVTDLFEDQYAWVEEKIGGFEKEGNISGISYKIYDDYKQGAYDYTKRGYYFDTFKQPDSPEWYIITSGERPELSYIIIQDLKIDNESNVEVIVKEYIGTPVYPDVIGVEIPKIYPACCIEFTHDSAEKIKSITIKNTEGEVFEKLN